MIGKAVSDQEFRGRSREAVSPVESAGAGCGGEGEPLRDFKEGGLIMIASWHDVVFSWNTLIWVVIAVGFAWLILHYGFHHGKEKDVSEEFEHQYEREKRGDDDESRKAG